MIKLCNFINNPLVFKGDVNNINNPNREERNDTSISSDYSFAATSYGKAQCSASQNPRVLLYDEIQATPNNAIIPLDEAIGIFSDIKDLNTKNKAKFISACSFFDSNDNIIVNKKALLVCKQDILGKSIVPKYEKALRASIDENCSFNMDKFDSYFNSKGEVRISASFPIFKYSIQCPRVGNVDLRTEILKELKKTELHESGKHFDVPITSKDLFTPLSQTREELHNQLDDLKKNNDISEDLYKSFKKAVDDNNFDLRTVYQDHYELLNDCETLDDVKEFYPEIEYPNKPEYKSNMSQISLNNRLSKENFDEVSIPIIRQLYLDYASPSSLLVEFHNSSNTSLVCLERAGFCYSRPSENLKQFLDKTDVITGKLKSIASLDDEQVKKYAERQAFRSSNIWDSYKEKTKGLWLPIKLINSKQKNPEVSKYRTDKLVKLYLYQLYKQSGDVSQYPKNPFEKFDTAEHLNPEIFKNITNIYISKYKEKEEPSYDINFEMRFRSHFDEKAMGKSLEHMEKLYSRVFFGQYFASKGHSDLKDALQNAYDLIDEKRILGSDVKSKAVTDSDVDNVLIEEYGVVEVPKIDDKEISEFKFMTSNIKNNILKERFMSCLSDTDNVDIGYFSSMYNIAAQSFDKTDKKLDESKAEILLYFYDKYWSEILNSDSNFTEEEYINNSLAKYKEQGEINYSRVKNDIIEPIKYEELSLSMIDDGYEDVLSVLDEKFLKRNDGADYTNANVVMKQLYSLPESLRRAYIGQVMKFAGYNKFIILDKASAFYDKVSKWNMDKDEVIIMDRDKIPQIVIIEQGAKEDLWRVSGENVELYRQYWSSFRKAAERSVGQQGQSGIKTVRGQSDIPKELKIKGKSKSIRMFPREITQEDRDKYENSNDGIKIKYIFSRCGEHL